MKARAQGRAWRNVIILMILLIIGFILAYGFLYTETVPKVVRGWNAYVMQKIGKYVRTPRIGPVELQEETFNAKLDVTFTTICADVETIEFSCLDSKVPEDQMLDLCSWDFDKTIDSNQDGDYGNDPDAEGFFAEYNFPATPRGKYTVTLIAITDKGFQDRTEVDIEVLPNCLEKEQFTDEAGRQVKHISQGKTYSYLQIYKTARPEAGIGGIRGARFLLTSAADNTKGISLDIAGIGVERDWGIPAYETITGQIIVQDISDKLNKWLEKNPNCDDRIIGTIGKRGDNLCEIPLIWTLRSGKLDVVDVKIPWEVGGVIAP